MNIFDMLITRPFGWVLWAILQVVNNYGFAIIVFSLLAKAILYPLGWKGKKGMVAQQRLQPKMKELQKKYANNKAKYQEEVQKLYTENKVSPMSGCLPQLIVLPIMFALYWVIQKPLTFIMGIADDAVKAIAAEIAKLPPVVSQDLFDRMIADPVNNQIPLAHSVTQYYDKITHVDGLMPLNFNFLGLDLSGTPSITALSWLVILPILSGVTAFLVSWVSQKLMTKTTGADGAQGAGKAMIYMMPLLSVWIGFSLPAGITLYWIANNLFSMLQEWWMSKKVMELVDKESAMKELEEDRKNRKREEARLQQIELAAAGKIPKEPAPKKHPSYKLKKAENIIDKPEEKPED